MNIHFIKSTEKRRIVENLNEQFGIEELPYLLIESGKEKIRAFSGSLSKDEIAKISEIANLETIGLYILKKESDFRLSLDACLMLSNQITKNIIEIDEKQFNEWIRGLDLQLEKPQGTYVIKFGEDFIGCGRSNGKTIFNYVPKDRRLKKQLIA